MAAQNKGREEVKDELTGTHTQRTTSEGGKERAVTCSREEGGEWEVCVCGRLMLVFEGKGAFPI